MELKLKKMPGRRDGAWLLRGSTREPGYVGSRFSVFFEWSQAAKSIHCAKPGGLDSAKIRRFGRLCNKKKQKKCKEGEPLLHACVYAL